MRAHNLQAFVSRPKRGQCKTPSFEEEDPGVQYLALFVDRVRHRPVGKSLILTKLSSKGTDH